jgi:hypothetical protein
MSGKSRSGCVVAAVIGLAVLVAMIALVVVFSFKWVRAGKREVQSHLEDFKAREEARAAEEQEKVVTAVALREGELADYSAYQKGTPLSAELFLAWRLDPGATTLAKEVFVEKVEGSEVVWKLQAGDLRTQGETVVGTFYLHYTKSDAKDRNFQSGVEGIECRFAAGSKESLLAIRRDRPAMIGGRLSLKNGQVVIQDARLATEDVEK